MIPKRIQKGKTTYRCSSCGFIYQTKPWAQKCEQWCRTKKSCNIKITKHSISI